MLQDKKERLDNTIVEISKVLEKYKNDESIKEQYERIEKLKEKRNLK